MSNMKKIVCFTISAIICLCSTGQEEKNKIIKDILRNSKEKAVQKTQQKIDEKIDKTGDSLATKKISVKGKKDNKTSKET
jgi:hypothetical protein